MWVMGNEHDGPLQVVLKTWIRRDLIAAFQYLNVFKLKGRFRLDKF